jgi:glycosyltransferase involved in cell wall biosynthesis
MENPLVSIVIPVYNGSDYLRQAIDSALAQTYPSFEVIVVDDGSRDGGATSAIAQSFGGRIRYLRKENGGVGSALNAGLKAARGSHFSWLSHDDAYYPWKLQAQVDLLRELGKADVVLHGAFDLMNERSEVFAHAGTRIEPERFRFQLIVSSPVHGCTLLVPMRLFHDVGCFREDLRTTQDYDLWFRMAARTRFLYLDRPLLKSRIHAAQGTRRMAEIVVSECNDLVISFLEQMTAEEAAASAGLTPQEAYLKIAQSFRARAYRAASKYLRARSVEFFGGRARAAAFLAGAAAAQLPRRIARALRRLH